MATFNYKSQSKRSLELSDKYYDLANSYLDNFIDKLVAVSIFSLGFIGLLSQKVDIRNYQFSEYVFILGALAFIVVILIGIFLKNSLKAFLGNVGDTYYERHKRIEAFIFNSNRDCGTDPIDKVLSLPEVPGHYATWWYKLQITLFLIGVICFGFLLFSLFTFDSFKDVCLQIV